MASQFGRSPILGGIAVLAGIYLASDSVMDQPAPPFSLSGELGATITLDSYRGRPLLLAFWTTSCGICRRELPILNDLQPEFQKKGIQVLAVNLGEGDDARNYLRSNHLDLRLAMDPEGAVGQAYRVSGIPKLVLIGSDGKIKRTNVGTAGPRTLRRWMDVVSGT